MIHEIDEFVPEAGGISQELSLHCHLTVPSNLLCQYHFYHDTQGLCNDETPGRKGYHVTGTHHHWNVNKVSMGKNQRTVQKKWHIGYFYCGCPKDEVLLAFYWFKNGMVTSPVNNISEGWWDQMLDSQAHMLMAAEWEHTTQSKVDIIFVGLSYSGLKNIVWWRATVVNLQLKIWDAEKAMKERVAKAADSKELVGKGMHSMSRSVIRRRNSGGWLILQGNSGSGRWHHGSKSNVLQIDRLTCYYKVIITYEYQWQPSLYSGALPSWSSSLSCVSSSDSESHTNGKRECSQPDAASFIKSSSSSVLSGIRPVPGALRLM